MSSEGVSYGAETNTGALIRSIRKSAGISQSALAERVGVSYQQIQKYEYGKSELTIPRLRQIADALGVPAEVFLGGGASSASDEARAAALFRGLRSRDIRLAAVRVLAAMAEADAEISGSSA